jgi:hypothetical protein
MMPLHQRKGHTHGSGFIEPENGPSKKRKNLKEVYYWNWSTTASTVLD